MACTRCIPSENVLATPEKHIFFSFALWISCSLLLLRSDSELIAFCLLDDVSAFSQYYQMHASKPLIWFDSVWRCVVVWYIFYLSACARASNEMKQKKTSSTSSDHVDAIFRTKSNFRRLYFIAFDAKHFYLTRFGIVCRSVTRNLRRENYYMRAADAVTNT